MEFSDKEKLVVNEAMKEAESYTPYPFATVVGVIKNNQPSTIVLSNDIDITGKFITLPPPNANGIFVHQGVTSLGSLQVPLGSKGAVLFSTNGANKIAWLLAWENPDDDNIPSKVYVKTGYWQELYQMDGNEIGKKLDKATNISQYWDDKETFAIATAEIKDSPRNVAYIGASFGLHVPMNPL